MPQPQKDQLAQLGALVREHRENLGLSMEQLAERAGMGRSTLHRIENPGDIVSKPPKVAKVLVVLGVDEATLRQAVPDGQWVDELAEWMTRVAQLNEARQYVNARRTSAVDRPDLFLLHPDGTLAALQFKQVDDDVRDAREAELVRALRTLGYMVSVPIE